MYRLKHILVLLFAVLCSTGLYAQIHIGDGVTITKGSSIVITNQDVIINTEEINGNGNLIITNDSSQLISVNTKLKTLNRLDVRADNIEVNGDHATKFTAMYLPQLSNEIKIAAKKEQKENMKQELPSRYINVEGLVFSSKDEENAGELIFKALPENYPGGAISSHVIEIHAIDFEKDFIIPIYSILNDARFSDDAKLYEFEGLTAILKPPIT